jgi:aryl-alcohol dehydrogenase (NADP+)
MEIRRTAGIGLEIPRIGLGCVTFGREIDEAQSFRVLDYAFEHGVTLLDTAEGYGGGQAHAYRRSLGIRDSSHIPAEMHSSEKIIGRWLRSTGLRKKVLLQTKIARDFTRKHLAEALSASLERLQTDYVDLYLFHSYDRATPLDEAMGAMTEAARSGAVRAAGCSNFNFEQLREALALTGAHGLSRMEVIQPVYNLVRREIERDILPLCRENGIAPVIYSPLGAGFLAGKYAPGSAPPKGARFDVIPGHADEYFSVRNFAIVERLRDLAQRTGVAMVRLAMAWVLKNQNVAGVLVGARGESQIDNALAALAAPLAAEIAAEMDSW